MTDTVRLVRHTEVARAWHGRCYGASDVPLSREGRSAMSTLSARLAGERPGWVVHSGLIRTRLLAERIAIVAGCRLEEDTAWRERSFGAWEGLSWNAIYRSTGSAMDGMIDAPDHFRPGGGETTSELARRAALAWDSLPRGSGIVVTHGGPIAALLGRQRDLPPMAWPGLIPLPGSVVDICR